MQTEEKSVPGKIETVLIVGAGIMGHGFAQFMAMNHLKVYLVDQTDEFLERARGGSRTTSVL